MITKNCEHFANMIVYGINFSQQVCEKWDGVSIVKHTSDSLAFLSPWASSSPLKTIKRTVFASISSSPLMLNNGKSSICLESEIRNTNSLLGKKFDFETEKYEDKYLQEIPPRESCRIM